MLHRHKKDNLSEMPGFLLGGLTVLICGEASMLSASIRKMFNTSWFAVYLQKTLHFFSFSQIIGLKTSKHEFTDRIHQNKQGFEGKKLSGKEFLAFEEYQRESESMCGRHGSANCTQRFSILFSYLDFCFLSSRILQNNLLHLYLVKIRRYKLSFFAKRATNSLPHFSIFKIA